MTDKDSEQQKNSVSEATDSPNRAANDSSLENLVEQEQTVPRQKLIESLGREPTQTEIDRWLSEHTEGY